MKVLYTTEAVSTGGRDGQVRTADGLLDTQVATPKELGGPGGATNPEQLFAAGYAACFHSALRLVAGKAGVAIDGSTVAAEVGLGANGAGGFGLTVALTTSLPGVPAEQAEKLVAKAHEVCPYSNATRGNIDVAIALA
ncbi:organic hydroperoxide resistance protein [Longispora fulva]|uniref:Ohr subfamily peroxiredoxin n=1 Tax=Longispora fulva TaxID=619741 RepID=A0A8J7GJN4_9ACTN|nr:organic hydroperoxide resistance protein [Longispora fulva]MBG6137813.1 Ohr subfamily peroxiredoxin [Longispora fulva]GIG62029.1 organic hydroperoxide resistance protein [Longispora fulva]